MANVSISYRRRKFACLKNCSATRWLHDPRTLLPAGKLFKGFLSFIVVIHITVSKLYRHLIFCWFLTDFSAYWGRFLPSLTNHMVDWSENEANFSLRQAYEVKGSLCLIQKFLWNSTVSVHNPHPHLLTIKKKILLNSSHWFPFLNCHPLNK